MTLYLLECDDRDYYTNTSAVAIFSTREKAEARAAEMVAWDRVNKWVQPRNGGQQTYEAWLGSHPYGHPDQESWSVRELELDR